ncbi:hypothetical protein QQX98_000318 [Neonectria punicea]|uniref:Uncharacterized protein n=1 Tax=Neonectria punicea TaxID=979145 RepID=A0ABR1HU49_9HYPO
MSGSALSGNVAALEHTVTTLQEIIDQQRVKLDQQHHEITDLLQHQCCDEYEIRLLQDSVQKHEAKFEEYMAESVKHQQLHDQEKMRNEEFQGTLATVERDRERLWGDIAGAEHLINCMKAETADLKGQLIQYRELVADKEMHNDVLDKACTESDNREKTLQGELAVSYHSMDLMNKRIVELDTGIEKLINLLRKFIREARAYRTGTESTYRYLQSINEQVVFNSLLRRSREAVNLRPELIEKLLNDSLKSIGVSFRKVEALPTSSVGGQRKRRATWAAKA